MFKIALGLIGVLLVAACSYVPPQQAAASFDGHVSGVGHPDNTYPGPRAY